MLGLTPDLPGERLANLRSNNDAVEGRRDLNPNGLALGDMPGIEQMELDLAGEADRAGLAWFAGGEVAGFLGLTGAGPAGAVAGEQSVLW